MCGYMSQEAVLRHVRDEMPQGFSKELVGRGQVLFTVTEEDTGSRGKGSSACLCGKSGLALTGFSGNQYYAAAITTGNALNRFGDGVNLAFSSHYPSLRAGCQARREGNDGD